MAHKPAAPVSGADPADRVSRAEGAAGPDPVTHVGPAHAVEGAQRAAPAAQVERLLRGERVQDIAARLRRGDISPAQAVEELIDDAVHSSLPGDPAEAELRASLKAYVEEDPYLSSRVRRLGPAR